jgi:molybdopterin/thiamine biosynthesis adenylyltransferase
MPESFNYERAFSRNIGWVSEDEQAVLRNSRVAVAGLGGAGGHAVLTLARLGVGKFRIADFDTFGVHNFNRQAGATMSTLDEAKIEVMARMVRDINPEAEIELYRDGVSAENLPAFLDGVDVYLDGLDFFVFDIRQKTFAMCAKMKVPAVTAAPLGMGTAFLAFLPGQMTFEEYFQWGDLPEADKAVRFLVGLAPAGLHRPYLAVPSAVNFAERRGPSTIMALTLCAGVSVTQVLKIILKRGKVLAAPHGMHFDAYRNKLVHTWRPGGNKNPIQRLAIFLGKRFLAKAMQAK